MAKDNDLVKSVRKQFQYTDSQISAFAARLDKFLFAELSRVLKPVEKDPTNQAEALRVLGSLFSALKEAGLQDELKPIFQVYGSQITHIREEFAKLGVSQLFSDTDVSIVKNLIDFDTQAVANKIHNYTDDVAATVMRSVIAGEEIDIGAVHEKFGATLGRQIETETQTLLAGFSRAVTVGKAKELGFDLFMYIGPDDKVTRPFCEHLLQRDPAIYTQDEIQKMDNEQGLDVFTYGGGYNCRHDWRPVSEDRAKELGYYP